MSTTLTAKAGPAVPAAALPTRRTRGLALPEARWAAAATLAFLLALLARLLGAPGWTYGVLYGLAYATGGWEPAWAGLRALRDRTLDVDLLMIVAALGAAAIGQVLDGALLIVIFATSGALEALATARTADSVRGLLDLAPATATRLDSDGHEETVPAAALAVGDTVLVRPGERIGADGRVLEGLSEVDQSTITGEPLPVAKSTGDEVFAGTLNGVGALRIAVERDSSDTVIARIVAMVEEAGSTKAPTQLFIEKVEQRYAVGLVAATLALFALPLAFGGGLTETLLRAMTFMIVASPCAVVLATMPPLLSAIATAGRHGVLVKSAVVMECLGQVTAVALDKTGTLTAGTPQVVEVRPTARPDGVTADELLALAAAAEVRSEHPLGRAIVAAAHGRATALPDSADFASTPGTGVRATVDGRVVEVGNPARLPGDVGAASPAEASTPTGRVRATRTAHAVAAVAGAVGTEPGVPAAPGRAGTHGAAVEQGLEPTDAGNADQAGGSAPDPGTARAVAESEAAGRTAVLVLRDGQPLGVLGLADRPREHAADAVRKLAALTGRPPVLLTGDNPRAAAGLAAELGLPEVRAGLLPQEKAAAVQELEADGKRVLMLGDGVNDAPSLAAAHCGVAMGRAGSDLALETADAVVVRDELLAVPAVVALSRRARRLVVQNLVIAGVFIAALVVWDLVGTLPLPLGVAGHEGSTVIVGLNGLRLLRDSAWRRALSEGS